jgi:phospholipase C
MAIRCGSGDTMIAKLPRLLLLAAACLATTGPQPAAAGRARSLADIDTIVVIYGENRSFDNLYGLFPGANGIDRALRQKAPAQKDRDGKAMAVLPPVWAKGDVADPAFPSGLPNRPFRIDAPPVNLPLDVITRDLVHRFYQNQEQIDGGRNDLFAALSDAGGLAMGYYDGSSLPLFHLARQYVLADNFFMAAFGGSFLNHFWLVCACTPQFPNAPDPLVIRLDDNGKLLRQPDSPASALDGPPRYVNDGAVTPDGYAVNTMQPPYQPSGTAPDPANAALAAASANPLPPQTARTIGDTLSAKGVSWKWYAGGWNTALADRQQIYKGSVNFQAHHQPFNYFRRFAPGGADRAEHLKDEADLLADIADGALPQVVFYKPQGSLNEHPGYADVLSGDRHIADFVARLQASKQWPRMAIIVTYDENGGFWDHVPPPPGDRWGPGMRIPAMIISPLARRGYVDHTPYDTTSILKFITRRFGLEPLLGVRAAAGDLTRAFDFRAGTSP